MHEIEDLVEDSVRLVDRSDLSRQDKISLLNALYRYQELFDTSYTHFRVMDMLLASGYVKRMALADHPDYSTHAAELEALMEGEEEGDWIPASMEAPDAGGVYAQRESGQVFVYCEAGDTCWRRLKAAGQTGDVPAPMPMTVPQLVRQMTALSESLGETSLLLTWCSAFAVQVLEGDLGAEQGVKPALSAWLNDGDLLAIRERMTAHDWPKAARKNKSFPVPALSSELRYANSLEQAFKARLVLESGRSPDDLRQAYEKELKKESALVDRLQSVSDILGDHFKAEDWQLAWAEVDAEGDESRWLWFTDEAADEATDDGAPGGGAQHRYLALASYSKRDKWLDITLAVQHAKILKWQQRSPDTSMKGVHFYSQLPMLLDTDWVDANKSINGLCTWDLKPGASQKVWTQRLKEVVSVLPEGVAALKALVHGEFPRATLARGFDAILDALDTDGAIPDHIIFQSSFSYGLVFYFDALDKKQPAQAEHYLQWIEEKVTPRMRERNDWCRNELGPFLDAVKNGASPPMPLLAHPKYSLF
ncbi:hypothetical protein NBRC116584_24440 [Hydrogenophaga sp. 5NK40-0174]